MEDSESRIVKLLQTIDELQAQIRVLREQKTIAQQTIQAIRLGEVDAVVVSTEEVEKVFTLEGVDYIYRLFVEQMGEGAATVSWEGFILYSNQKLAKLLGCPLENIIGSRFQKFVFYQDLPRFESFLQQAQKQIAITEEILLISCTGNEIPVQLSLSQLNMGNTYIYCIIITDLTEYKRKEEALRESEERFRKSFIDSPFPMIIYAEDGEVLEINQAWTELSGYSINDLRKITNWLESAFAENQDLMLSLIERIYQIDRKVNLGEFPIKTRWGEQRIWNFHSLPLSILPDGRKTFMSMAIDVTDRNRAEELLRRNALYDALTGLPNRILLMDRLEQAIEHSKRDQNYLFAVAFLDLDRFKLINDTLGHEMGDKVLIAYAKKFSQCVRSGDTVARLGGDEFIILLLDIHSKEEAIQIAERLMLSFNLPITIDGKLIFITASMGITFSSRKIVHATELLSNADLAMYDAKHFGKACYRIFEPSLYQRTTRKLEVEKLELEGALSEALKHQQFMLYYQPIFSLITLKLEGFEALVRWKHPQKGLISPEKFIPIAEETGLIIPLGEWILSEACRQIKAWQEHFENAVSFRMSVNVSGRQLQESNCVEKVDEILAATGLPAKSLKLEITESLLMENKASFSDFLTQMKQRGIELSIDDFGTGYSSLSYLHRLPFNSVKIDRSFITNISTEEDSVNIVRAIITLAHQLNINVIAEGIETEQQCRKLQELGCEFGQGYFFARPLDAKAAQSLLMARVNSS
ncbi:EAL domain-containing protein [Phormidium sp. LEGE 05292]|uniref:sensor domain-containing protein n=1 Tax=[Phormidium] sp. LEGE 05292 TaxID=767427 RepID=UPI001880D710|nr:bifunctional diguanylate cyclase/phosphodiesterase [Phormidium sp. LEGE 05292]MBE9228305.1 EAL domain-containing protein [Phormidium sp. LEGE 05292]